MYVSIVLYTSVAQWIEQTPSMRKVTGSSPVESTTRMSG